MIINCCYGQKISNIVPFLLLLFSISCKDNRIELAGINFPISKSKFIDIGNNGQSNFNYDQELSTYLVKNLEHFTLFNQYFKKKITNNSDIYSGENFLQFIGKKDIINGYRLHIYTKKESSNLLETLLSNLGKPQFEEDESFEKYIIWENKNKIFILNQGDATIQNIKTIESELLCFNKDLLLKAAINATSNTKYSNYLEYRQKIKKDFNSYPYSQYKKEH